MLAKVKAFFDRQKAKRMNRTHAAPLNQLQTNAEVSRRLKALRKKRD